LEVAKANAGAKATVSYANVVKGTPPFTTPPPPLPPTSTLPPQGAKPPPGEGDELATLLRGIMAYLCKRQQ
jgi:hypothetical protein